jgi:hypothetical protein
MFAGDQLLLPKIRASYSSGHEHLEQGGHHPLARERPRCTDVGFRVGADTTFASVTCVAWPFPRGSLYARRQHHPSLPENGAMRILGSNPVLTVHDLERSAAWYCDVLGGQVGEVDPGNWTFCRAGGVTFMLGRCPDVPAAIETRYLQAKKRRRSESNRCRRLCSASNSGHVSYLQAFRFCEVLSVLLGALRTPEFGETLGEPSCPRGGSDWV